MQVGAGLPVIASVTRVISSGDPISRIVGSLSGTMLLIYCFDILLVKVFNIFFLIDRSSPMLIGTLGYVMSELEDGKAFSEIVRVAKSLGYTEPGLDYDFIMSVGQYSYTPAQYVNYIPENLKYCIP